MTEEQWESWKGWKQVMHQICLLGQLIGEGIVKRQREKELGGCGRGGVFDPAVGMQMDRSNWRYKVLWKLWSLIAWVQERCWQLEKVGVGTRASAKKAGTLLIRTVELFPVGIEPLDLGICTPGDGLHEK